EPSAAPIPSRTPARVARTERLTLMGPYPGSEVELHDDRRVVTHLEAAVPMDEGAAELRGCRRVAEQVVDAPPAIELSGAPAVAPPGVGPLRGAHVHPEQVRPPPAQELTEPLALVRQEARVVLVALGVVD